MVKKKSPFDKVMIKIQVFVIIFICVGYLVFVVDLAIIPKMSYEELTEEAKSIPFIIGLKDGTNLPCSPGVEIKYCLRGASEEEIERYMP